MGETRANGEVKVWGGAEAVLPDSFSWLACALMLVPLCSHTSTDMA